MLNRIALIAVLIIVLGPIFGCADRETALGDQTATISPATPPSATGDDTDTASTQTVEIGEERSPNEGGVLTDPDHTATTGAATGTPSPSPTPSS